MPNGFQIGDMVECGERGTSDWDYGRVVSLPGDPVTVGVSWHRAGFEQVEPVSDIRPFVREGSPYTETRQDRLVIAVSYDKVLDQIVDSQIQPSQWRRFAAKLLSEKVHRPLTDVVNEYERLDMEPHFATRLDELAWHMSRVQLLVSELAGVDEKGAMKAMRLARRLIKRVDGIVQPPGRYDHRLNRLAATARQRLDDMLDGGESELGDSVRWLAVGRVLYLLRLVKHPNRPFPTTKDDQYLLIQRLRMASRRLEGIA